MTTFSSVRFSVIDEGPGVDPEEAEAIFQPFRSGALPGASPGYYKVEIGYPGPVFRFEREELEAPRVAPPPSSAPGPPRGHHR